MNTPLSPYPVQVAAALAARHVDVSVTTSMASPYWELRLCVGLHGPERVRWSIDGWELEADDARAWISRPGERMPPPPVDVIAAELLSVLTGELSWDEH